MVVSESWLKTTREQAAADKDRLAKLTLQREKLDADIKNLVEKVRSWDVILGGVKGAAKVAVSTDTPAARVPEPTAEPLGFRDAIRLALTPGPLKPREVTAKLIENGFRLSGKSDLSIRVSSELWRMTRNGLLRKARGAYSLPKANEQQESTMP